MRKSAIVIGASSGLGRSISYQLAQKGYNLILSSRNKDTLFLLGQELKKYDITVEIIPLDLESTSYESSNDFVSSCFNAFDNINEVYLTSAIIDERDYGNSVPEVLEKINNINYRGSALIISAFAKKLNQFFSRIVVISSIAAIRPRSKNIAYSASKVALEYHIQSLQHYYSASPMKLQFFRVGYMDTQMSKDQKLLFKKRSPESVAHFILKSTKQNSAYYPKFWFIIALILNSLPWVLYKRLKF